MSVDLPKSHFSSSPSPSTHSTDLPRSRPLISKPQPPHFLLLSAHSFTLPDTSRSSTSHTEHDLLAFFLQQQPAHSGARGSSPIAGLRRSAPFLGRPFLSSSPDLTDTPLIFSARQTKSATAGSATSREETNQKEDRKQK
jgi:hypothetical protein